MSLVVLISQDMGPGFASKAPEGIVPVFYRNRRASRFQRFARKLGWLHAEAMLRARVILPEADRLDDVEAVWLTPRTWLAPDLMESLLDRLPKLRWVFSQVTGYDHLELESFRKRGVALSNSGRLHSRRVAELALACVLAAAKRLTEHAALQRRRRWRALRSQDLATQTVGIVGTGNIGGELASMCRSLKMTVWGASRGPERFDTADSPYDRVVSIETELDQLLRAADFVVLTLPLNEHTRGRIGAEALAQMKQSGVLINVGRGAVVDEAALCKALARGRLAGAWLDVVSRLPPGRLSRLYRTPGLFLTHYSGAASGQSSEQALGQFIAGLDALVTGKELPDRVV